MSARVPFSNGSEVEWFTDSVCSRCTHNDPNGGGCDEFALPVMMGKWPDLLLETERTPTNPLGLFCDDFEESADI